MSWEEIDALKERALNWQREREQIMARETVSSRWADDIQASDDEGCLIADELAELAKEGKA